MSASRMKVYLSAYDHRILDESALSILKTIEEKKSIGGGGAIVSGPVPLPTKIERYTVICGPHKHKKSREHFERRTHKRLLCIRDLGASAFESLKNLDLPAGLEVRIVV